MSPLFLLFCLSTAALISGGQTQTINSLSEDTTEIFNETTREPEPPLNFYKLEWHYVSFTLMLTIFLLLISLFTVGSHYLGPIPEYFPETCALVVIGVLVSLIFNKAVDLDVIPQMLTFDVFMLYILPPIVLDAAYGLNNRVFASNIGTILLQAIIGTLANFLLIGPFLYGITWAGAMGEFALFSQLRLVDFLLFSSIIVAVDPVAVIAIFKDLGVNESLYYLVFGESLLNDAVTVVIYELLANMVLQEKIEGSQIEVGVAFFLASSVGGALIGVVLGLLTAFITKFTYRLPAAEPIIVLAMAYLAYLLGQLLTWSSIIALTVCGLVQAQFVFPHLDYESERSVRNIAGIAGSLLEASVFLFLGAEIITRMDQLTWHAGFKLWTIVAVLGARACSIFGLTALANWIGRTEKVSIKNQFIMWYGGLRGALVFVLCEALHDDYPYRNIFLTTTIVVVLFTVMFQGITIRFLVKGCGVKMKDKALQPILLNIENMMDDKLLWAMEAISGHYGNNTARNHAYSFIEKMKRYLARYPNSYATSLIEELEARNLSEVNVVREEQPHGTYVLFKAVATVCCPRNKRLQHCDSQSFSCDSISSSKPKIFDGSFKLTIDKNNNLKTSNGIDNTMDVTLTEYI